MMMTTLSWRVVSVWLIVALASRYHVRCTEQHQETQSSMPKEDISLEEEPGETTYHHKIEENRMSHIQSLSEDDLLTLGVGEDQAEEEPVTQELDRKEEDAEVFEVEEPASEVELEPEKGLAEPKAEAVQDPEKQHLEASVIQDKESDSSELLPPSSDPTHAPAAEPEDPPSIPTSQDLTPNHMSDAVVLDVDALELSDDDPAPADCEAGEANPYDKESPPVVLENTSNAHTAGTKTQLDPSLSPQTGHSTQPLGSNTSHMLMEQGLSSPIITDTDSSVGNKDPEDIPTFDEWKRKMMEVEKEKTQATHTSTNGGTAPAKKVQKNFNNYASVECGAKILGANPEAKSTAAILKENVDLYMLNPCSNKIWFIIELCEPIQLKQLDIANFELFSSTPKDFLVSISDRYPTNKWLKLGTFHARDERTVQSFPLDEHLYAKYVKMFTKYIKVELVSHFGSEHFCPLSLIRVFGTSMVEEYEEIAYPPERPDDPDEDFDSPSGYVPGEVKSSKNLIGSAKDVILNMVNNIAVNVLGGGSETQGNFSTLETNLTEPSSLVDTTTQTTATNLHPLLPDIDKVEASLQSLYPTEDTPSSEPPVPEKPTQPELPISEERMVTPLQEKEEEPTNPTVILLEMEKDLEEVKDEPLWRQQESLDYCAPLLLFSSSSFVPSCSCSASLQEYLHQQCDALLFKLRICQTLKREPTIPPHIQTPSSQQLPLSSSACPEPQVPHTEMLQLQEKETAYGQGEREASHVEASDSLGDLIVTQKDFRPEPPLLEPSQTTNLPKPSSTESPTATPTLSLQLSSKDQLIELTPGGSKDVQMEEKHKEPPLNIATSTPVSVKPTSSVVVDQIVLPLKDEKPTTDFYPEGLDAPTQIPDIEDQPQFPYPTIPTPSEQQPAPPSIPDNGSSTPESSHLAPNTVTEPLSSNGLSSSTDTKVEDLVEDIIFTSSNGNGQVPRPSSPASTPSSSSSSSEFYAELSNGMEQGNGNQVHGSSQKESVFMRLNNRIKALEMNMSLSGRYLEQLSQRYRKQMEEMQRAFNKTIIKLQNTSRIAEEQDQRQTESIQSLQGQLENVTQLVLNLSIRVSQLQSEVSDRQSYLLLSLVLCLLLGLLLCANHCRMSTMSPAGEPEPPTSKSYSYCCPERQFSSCDDLGLKRRASYPLLHSESLQLPTTEGPGALYTEATHSPDNRTKACTNPRVETLKPSSHSVPELANGAIECNGVPIPTNSASPVKGLIHPSFRDSPTEGSSEGSSQSDDPSFCGITKACTRICEGLPAPKTRAEKRALRRRRPKSSCTVVDLVQAPRRDKSASLPISTFQDLVSRKKEQSSGTFRVNAALSGSV
ncbi:SUN domain-containing ossification factor-like isoform X2 [Lampris incognitus]|uniref:SUN domain-containing ossification factor-like isoform X2 n=1 Tax=Lampris incognitus TaxID=2546036 RepID=UPI0024B4D4B5|nr:SUN domain-containing ossification factor-like isoform X2 [Lampris incognitus]